MITEQANKKDTVNNLEELFFPQSDTYKIIVDDLISRENDELKSSRNKAKTKTKYTILRIITKYNLFTGFLGESNTIDEFFLHSNEAKIHLLTNGCIFGEKSKLNMHTLSDKKLETEKDFVMLTPDYYESESNFIEDNINNLFWWRGCEMKIPLEAQITLGFNKLFFSVYVKSKDNFDEINIEESAWNVTYVYNNESFIHEENLNSTYGSILTGAGAISKPHRTMVLSKKEFLEYINKDQHSENTNQEDYLSVDIDILKSLKDCKVVIQMPYQNPRVDALMGVKFSDSETSEIILTCP